MAKCNSFRENKNKYFIGMMAYLVKMDFVAEVSIGNNQSFSIYVFRNNIVKHIDVHTRGDR